MFDFYSEELTPEQEEALIDKAVDSIHKRGLDVPAILFAEMHKPLAFLGSTAAHVFSPFIVPFLGYDNVHQYAQLFGRRENVEKLLLRLEEAKTPKDPVSEAS